MNTPIFNPWAPPYLNGFNPDSPQGCRDQDAAIVWPTTGGFQQMTGQEERRNETLVLEQTDEFLWQALYWQLDPSSEVRNGFLYRVQDDQGNWISDDLIYCFSTPGTSANPFPIFPRVTYRRGQHIKFDIVNAALSTQGVQLVFRGKNRYWQ